MRNKLYYACMAVVLCVAGLVAFGCSRNDNNNPKEPAQVQKYHMVVNVSKGTDNPSNGQRRVLEFDGSTIKATWAKGEEVTVYNETKHTAVGGVLTAQSDGVSTILEGDLTGSIEPSDVLTLKFLCPDYAEQKGTLEYISANCDYAEASVTVASVSNGNITPTANAVFENKQAIVRFTLIDQADGTTLLKPTALTINDGTADIATLTDIPTSAYTTNGDGVLYVALPGFADKTVTLTARLGAYIYTYEKEHATFTNGQSYSITVKMDNNLPQGALPGGFSVSPTKKVRFSKGNLQYNAALGTHQCADGDTKQGTWRFAEHQWDYVGDMIDGTVYEIEVKCDNGLLSSTYTGWIDLFGWGTSGWNSGANAYQPYSTSTSNSDYYPGGSYTNSLIGPYANADWGVYNAISNGGNQAGLWRVLTQDEYVYLFHSRLNSDNLRGQAVVNNVHGYVLLPDGFVLPSGLSFSACPNNWTSNVYTAEQWSQMEAAGAVFLSTAGYREQASVYNISSNWFWGDYWSSTADDEEKSKYITFGENQARTDYWDYRFRGRAVRLVHDVQ